MGGREIDDVSSLVHSLNDSVLFPQRWAEAMAIFCRLVGASSAIASKRTGTSQDEIDSVFNILSPNLDRDQLKTFLEQFKDSEIPAVWRLEDWGRRMGSGAIMDDVATFGNVHLQVSPSVDALRDIFGCFRRAAITLKTDGTVSDFLFVQFPKSLKDFPSGSLEMIAKLSPLVASALNLSKLWVRKQHECESYLAAIEALASPIVVVDDQGRAEFLNQAAQLAIDGGAPFFVDVYSRFRCKELRVDASMAKWLREFTQKRHAVAAFTLSTSTWDADAAWTVDMVPILVTRHMRPLVLLSFEDTRVPLAISREDAAAKFQLTSAEYCVAVCLVRGLNLDQIAEERRTSLNTVKTQVRSVLRKTGARSGHDVSRRFLEASTMTRRRRLC